MYMYMEVHIRTVPLEARSMESPGTWAVGLLTWGPGPILSFMQKRYVFFIIDSYLQPHEILYYFFIFKAGSQVAQVGLDFSM